MLVFDFNATLYVLFLFCNHHYKEERADCFVLLSFVCLVTVNILWHFPTVPCVCLLCVIVVFPDHTHSFLIGLNFLLQQGILELQLW